jgi:hypothetical protein
MYVKRFFRIRRVKCGQEKPKCIRCSSTGRKCEYEDARNITGTFSSASASSTISILDNPLSSFTRNTVWRERRAFAYYFQHVALFVGGGLDPDLWSTFIPQFCHTEPAVWDAIITMSALCESLEQCSDFTTVTQSHGDALSWYSRSVSTMRRRIERGQVDIFVGLISCVLFICIEALQGRVEDALQLYGQGIHLINALRAQVVSRAIPATKAALLEDAIVPIFVYLGVAAVNPSAPSVGALLPPNVHAHNDHVSMPEFASLKSAREAIGLLGAEAMLFERACQEHLLKSHTSRLPQEFLDQQARLLDKLGSWYIAFTRLINSIRDGFSPQQVGVSALLFAYHKTALVIVTICVSLSRTMADACLPDFQFIVEQSATALDASARSNGTQPPFTCDMGVGLPLWVTCLRCRDPIIRRTALKLLRRAPLVQGFHSTTEAVTFAERIMVLEETRAMTIKKAQITSIMQSKSTNPFSEYQCHGEDKSNAISGVDQSSPINIPGTEFPAPPHPTIVNMRHHTTTSLLIPEEARIGPIFLSSMTNEDIGQGNPNHDATFLRFMWKQQNPASNTWFRVHERLPVTFSPLE